ncbi:MAG: DUF6498-containing protein [bacterium]
MTKTIEQESEHENPAATIDVVPEITAFGGTLALAFFSGWSTRDLIWSLWLSSLTVGFLSAAVKPVCRVFQSDLTALERVFSIIGVLGAMLMFSIHFGSFHYLYAAMLDLLMPLMDHPGRVYIGKLTWKGISPFSFWVTLGIAFSHYWPVAVLNVFRDRRTIMSENEPGKNFGPYRTVLKLHFLVMGLGACYGLGLESFPVYAAVFIALFVPATLWKRIFVRKPEG